MGHAFTRKDLDKLLLSIRDKTLGEIDTARVIERETRDSTKVTGLAGHVIEESVLGYKPNPSQEADLLVDGTPTELKTTGVLYKKVDRSMRFIAKEPSSITAVSVEKIVPQTFDDSFFWHKIEHLLFVFYWYKSLTTVEAKEYANFPIKGHLFYEFSENDLQIIKNDWQIIHDFIADLQAKYGIEEAKEHYPNLSTVVNKLTVYLDTAPKWPKKPRFRLRRRVVDFIVDKALNRGTLEVLPDTYASLNDLEKKCVDITNQYRGMTLSQILTHFGIKFDDNKELTDKALKQFAEHAVVRMFGGQSSKMSQVELFRKFGVVAKSIAVTSKGGRTEDMKMFSTDFDELNNPSLDFKDSEVFSYFHDNQLLCIMFQEKELAKGEVARLADNTFLGFKLLQFDDGFLDDAKLCWDTAREIIQTGKLEFVYTLDKNGNRIRNKKSQTWQGAPNLPKAEHFKVFFRGTGSTAADKVNILGVDMLRQSYWVKGTYIVEKLKDVPFIGQSKEEI